MATESQYPDAIIGSLTNLSGAVTDIDDDPDGPDGLWLTAPGSNNNTAVRASFPTPTGTPNTGSGLQSFRVYVRKTNHSTNPTVSIALYETGGGTQLALVAETTVSSTTGVVVSGTWDASLLGTADGSAVEVQVSGTVGGGPPGNRASLEVGAIEWVVDYTPAVTERTAAPAGASTLTVERTLTRPGVVAIAGASTAAVSDPTVTTEFQRSVSPTGASTLTVERTLTRPGVVAVAGASTFTATATVSGQLERTAAPAGASTLTVSDATVTTTFPRTVGISSASALHARWYTGVSGDSVAFDTAPTITGTVAQSETLTANDAVTYQATVGVVSASTLTAAATVSGGGTTYERTAAPAGASTLTVERTLTRPGVVAVAGASTFTATATVSGQLERTVAVSSASVLTVSDGDLTRDRAVAPAGASTLTVGRSITRPGAVSVSSASGLTVARTITRNSSVGIISDSGLTVARAITRDRQVVISSQSEMIAAGSVAGSSINVLISAASRLHVGWYKNTSALQFKSAPSITGTVADGQTLTVSDPVNYESGVAVDGASSVDAVADDPLTQATVSISAVSEMSAVRTVGSVLTLGGGTLNTAPDPDEISYTLDGAGTVFWAVFKASDNPDGATIEAGGDYFGGSIAYSGSGATSAQVSITNVVTGSYKICAVAFSPAGYSNIVPTSLTITNEFLVQIFGAGAVDVIGAPLTQRQVGIASSGSLDVGITIDRSVGMIGTSSFDVSPVLLEQNLVPAEAAFSGVSAFNAGITIDRAAAISGTSGAQVDALPTTEMFRVVDVTSASDLTALAGPIRNRTAEIAAISLVSVDRGRTLQRSVAFSAVSASVFSTTGFVFQRSTEMSAASSLAAATILGVLPGLLYARPGDKPFGGRIVTGEYGGIIRDGGPRSGKVIDSKRSGRIIQ